MATKTQDHNIDIRANDFEGQALAKKKWAHIKGTWAKVDGVIPITYVFVRQGQLSEERIEHYKNNRKNAIV